MNVTGELGDFDLGGILQILAGNRATGRLHVSAESDDVALFLEQGRLVSVASARLPLRLGRILRQHGLVTDSQVREALQVQKAEGRHRSLGEILVDRGWTTDEQISACLQNQCIVALARVLAAGKGHFTYKSGVRAPAKSPTTPFEATSILLEALHRTDLLLGLRAQLPPADATLAINPLLGDMFVPVNEDEIWIVGALRAGAGSWRDLVDLLQTDELVVLERLIALYDRGVVVVAPPGPTPAHETPAQASLLIASAD